MTAPLLLTTLTPPPPGFQPSELARWQLLAGTIALYTDDVAAVQRLIGDWTRLRGVLISEAPALAVSTLQPHLIWLQLPPTWRTDAATLVQPLLHYLDRNAELENQHRQRDSQLSRLHYDLESMHQDYQRVTGKLQGQLQQLRTTEAALKQVNDQLEQRVSQRTAELETALRELESFSSSVSHDLRAPLRAVIGFTADLKERLDDRVDEEERAQLARVLRLGQRMSQLIDDLMRLAKTSQSPLRPTSVDLTALANEIWQTFEQHDSPRTIRFDCQATPPAQADPALLRVVLENLLGNARKFTQKTADASVWFGWDAVQQAYVIGDNGAGFAMSDAGQLFAPFRRLHRQDQFEGTGIGLATVARIIHRHGGRIWPEAAENQGARFFFSLKPSLLQAPRRAP